MSVSKFIGSSLFLYLDSLVLAAGGWLFWVIISKLTPASEVGQAITIFSLVSLFNALSQLGLEYPLLKHSTANRPVVLGSSLAIELPITLATVPLLIITLQFLYGGSSQAFTSLSIALLLTTAAGFVARYVLLGISDAKSIVIIDIIATAVKFATGYILVFEGLGALGLVLSFLAYSVIFAILALVSAYKAFGVGFVQLNFIRKLIGEGLANMPSKLSIILIFNLSVTLLAFFGTPGSEIGVFYISLMITILGAGFVSSMAFMVIPASAMSKTDLSLISMRVGISLTVPIISILIVGPAFILSLIGTEYISGSFSLVVLSIAILPYCAVRNTISKFNFQGETKKVLYIGSVQIFSFLVSFLLLVPSYGTLGASFSILIAFTASLVPSIFWEERTVLKFIAKSAIAVAAGCAFGYAVYLFLGNIRYSEAVGILISATVTSICVFALKNASTGEIGQFFRIIMRKTQNS